MAAEDAAAVAGLDDRVVPFAVPDLDVRGRVVRLGASIDTILDRHGYPAPVSRVLGEAATRTQGGDFTAIHDFVLSDKFDLAAFKGQKLTFRDWDGQLRQPVLLAADNVVVSVSPQAEFLHQTSQLDTLGIDRPETECRK